MKIPFFIGPCVLESEALCLEIAQRLVEDLAEVSEDIELVFKGSFDKANRTSIDSYRGPGRDKGLAILEKIQKEFQLPTITDFHHPEEAEEVASIANYIQVPAFLCRQTDMIISGARACKRYGRKLNVKKGQFLAPSDCGHIVKKAQTILGLEDILITERGTSFGYQNLIVDMASFRVINSLGVRSIHDATHCVQRPSSDAGQSGGKREDIEVLALAAMAASAGGIFMETHPNPEQALSDKATAMPLEKVAPLVKKLLKIHKAL